MQGHHQQTFRPMILLVVAIFGVLTSKSVSAYQVIEDTLDSSRLQHQLYTVNSSISFQRVLDQLVIDATEGRLVKIQFPVKSPFVCVDQQQTLNMQEPWTPNLAHDIRAYYSQLGAVLDQHPAGRSWLDHLWLSWSGDLADDEWRYPTNTEPCWFSADAKASFTRHLIDRSLYVVTKPLQLVSDIAPTDMPVEFDNLTDVYWQIVDEWYQTSLVDFGRMHLAIAAQELSAISGVRLLVKLPAYPFTNAHFAFLAGYNDSLSFESVLRAVREYPTVDVVLPGIDVSSSTSLDAYEEIVVLAKQTLGVPQVWAAFRTHLVQTPDHWSEIHSLLQLYAMDAFLPLTSVDQEGASANLMSVVYANPTQARRWMFVKIAATLDPQQAPSQQQQGEPEITFHPIDGTLMVPLQIVLPSSVRSVPQTWLDNHNHAFHLRADWFTDMYQRTDSTQDVGIPGLDPSKTWWIWIAEIDCDSLPPTGYLHVAVNVTHFPEMDDVYELSCGSVHLLTLAQHKMDRFLAS